MKITHNKVGQNLNVVDGTKSEKTGKSANANKADGTKIGLNKELSERDSVGTDKMSTRVEMSPRAQELNESKNLLWLGPMSTKQKLKNFNVLLEGKYKVDSKQVADRMVDEHLNTIGGD